MPEEPQKTDRPIEPVEQWGETEPSPQPFVTSSAPMDSSPVEPVEAPTIVSSDSYFAYEEPQTVDQQPEVITPAWGENKPSTQPDVASVASTPEVPVSPTLFPIDTPVGSVVAPVAKKSKKPLIIGIILVVFFALLGGGGVLAYNLWYQNPEKVVTDALINAATAKTSVYTGTVKVESDNVKTVIDLTTKQADATTGSFDAKVTVTIAGKDYAVNGSALVDASGDLYFKVEKLAGIVAEYKSQLGSYIDASQSATIDKIVAKIDGTWIKVSSADLKEFSDTTATAKTCLNDTIKKFKDDKSAIAEVTNVYKKNPFIKIDKKLGEKDGSLGYVIKGDSTALKAFAEGLKTTKVYIALHACDSSFAIDTSSMDTSTTSTSSGTVELWVNSWSHQITKLTFNDASDGSTTSGAISPTYNQSVQIVTPTSSITLTQLKTDIEALLQDFTTSSALFTDVSTAETNSDVSAVQKYAEAYAADNYGSYPTLVQLKPTLPSGIQTKIGVVTPSASNPSALSYVVCDVNKGGTISYYDVSTQSIQHATVGTCA